MTQSNTSSNCIRTSQFDTTQRDFFIFQRRHRNDWEHNSPDSVSRKSSKPSCNFVFNVPSSGKAVLFSGMCEFSLSGLLQFRIAQRALLKNFECANKLLSEWLTQFCESVTSSISSLSIQLKQWDGHSPFQQVALYEYRWAEFHKHSIVEPRKSATRRNNSNVTRSSETRHLATLFS